MSTMSRFLGLGVALGLAGGLLVGVGHHPAGSGGCYHAHSRAPGRLGRWHFHRPNNHDRHLGRVERHDRRVCWSGDSPLS